ncbi:MAG: hypothetical protein CL707_03790 [Chloroflexi bacterium]|nr:hypothetical protein [Chloroflexota bacterium]
MPNFIIDFNKEINEQWNDQSISRYWCYQNSIDLYNFPLPTGSTLTLQKIFWRDENLKKVNEFFDLIKLKNLVTLNFKDSKDLYVLEELKNFDKVKFEISLLTMDKNKLFTDLKQLLQLQNMTIICKINPEIACHKILDVLKYVLVLKNKNYPGIVIIKDEI